MLDNIQSTLYKNAPSLLTVGAIGGFLSAAYLAIRVTPDANESLRVYDRQMSVLNLEDEPKWRSFVHRAKVVVPYYAPAILSFSAATLMLVWAMSMHKRRNAALIVMAASLHKARHRVEETLADRVTDKAFDEIISAAQAPTKPPPAQFVVTGEQTVCYDQFSDRYFHVRSPEVIVKILGELNTRLRDVGFVSLNDLYYELGLKQLTIGEELGWAVEDGAIDIRITSALIKDTYVPCVSLFYTTVPRFL
jgi:hypothetical protein